MSKEGATERRKRVKGRGLEPTGRTANNSLRRLRELRGPLVMSRTSASTPSINCDRLLYESNGHVSSDDLNWPYERTDTN